MWRAEFLVGLEPLSGSCPVGYSRIGKDDQEEIEEGEEDEHFICRDTASPYSVSLLCLGISRSPWADRVELDSVVLLKLIVTLKKEC